MFTGIIEEVGTLRAVVRAAKSAVLTIDAHTVLEDVRVGDSIAVNGVCLTVTAFDARGFSADVMHETLRRSSLGDLRTGSKVNLERAMPGDGRFGGHIVSGHIDGVGRVRKITQDDTAVWYSIQTPPQLMRYIVEKGSIAIDGISLTVAQVDATGFSVSTIPHTNAATTLAQLREGDAVNLECDIIGKYVERLMTMGASDAGSQDQIRGQEGTTSSITLDFLMENGF